MTDMQYGQDEEKKRRNRTAAATIAEAENKALTKKGSLEANPEQPAKKRPASRMSEAMGIRQTPVPVSGGSTSAMPEGRSGYRTQAITGKEPPGYARTVAAPGAGDTYFGRIGSAAEQAAQWLAASPEQRTGTSTPTPVPTRAAGARSRAQGPAGIQAPAEITPLTEADKLAAGVGVGVDSAGASGGREVPLDINMVGAPTNIQAIRQNPAVYSQVNEMGHGMGLTNMYNRLANQMRQDRMARQGERERRELLQQALTTPNAQYYNMSTEEGSLKAAQGRQQAALEALGITGKERAAQAEQLGRGEAAARQERQQDRAYNLQERGLQNREALAEQAARAEGRKQQQKAQERRGDLTGAGKAYFDARTEAMKLYRGGEMTQEEMDAVEQTALMAAADFGRAAGQYVDPNNGYRLLTAKEVEDMAKKQGLGIDELVAALGLIGGPR